jgi:hypothetical protein
MAGVFQNIDPPPPSPPGELVPPAFGAGGRTHSLVGEGGGGSIWKTSDTALYSTYVLCGNTFRIKKEKILCLHRRGLQIVGRSLKAPTCPMPSWLALDKNIS